MSIEKITDQGYGGPPHVIFQVSADDYDSAARAVLRAVDAYRDAVNGLGHPSEPHDRMLWHSTGGDMEIYSPVDDCAACGGAQYGTEDALNQAHGDLREAVGEPRKPWEGETRVTHAVASSPLRATVAPDEGARLG